MALFGNLRGLFVCSRYEHEAYSIPDVGLLLIVILDISNSVWLNKYIITYSYLIQ